MHERALTMIRAHGDTALAVALVCLVIVQIWGTDASATMRGAASAGALALLVPLARRRVMPVVLLAMLVALAAAGTSLPRPILDVEAVGLILLLSIYNGAAHTSGRRTVAAAALTLALGLGALIGDPEGVYLGGVIFFGLLLGAPWVTGRVVRRRRENEARLERERDDATAAIADERARIARELHDVVAHAISVIVLQARGGRRLLDSDPEETRGALTTIEGTARQALGEMRRLVGLLREDDATAALVPQPGLAGLDGLVADVRAAGLPVDVAVEGEPVDLPAGVDLSAFRIVQEALTNALKHAGPARARVLLRYDGEGLTIEISDDGIGPDPAGNGGHGLAGIRERVGIYGGELDAGPRAGGGYAVRARLPFMGAR